MGIEAVYTPALARQEQANAEFKALAEAKEILQGGVKVLSLIHI